MRVNSRKYIQRSNHKNKYSKKIGGQGGQGGQGNPEIQGITRISEKNALKVAKLQN